MPAYALLKLRVSSQISSGWLPSQKDTICGTMPAYSRSIHHMYELELKDIFSIASMGVIERI